MATPLKYLYSEKFTNEFTEVISQVFPSFPKARFFGLIHDEEWGGKELKQRMKHITFALHEVLPKNFQETAKIIGRTVEKLLVKHPSTMSFEYMFLADYIETYGIDDFDTSTKLMELVTQFASCEFAVRPFIVKYGDKMMDQMLAWSLHQDNRVRRLASEGSRPRLPWAMALPELKKDPSAILPILENLKHDPSEFVRRSVANNLNDIAKDNPGLVIAIAKKWKGKTKDTDAIVKHGCRTLLKQGNTEVLELFGISSTPVFDLEALEIHSPQVSVGGGLEFSFTLTNITPSEQTLRLEYAIYYLLKNGHHSKKVFKISERKIAGNGQVDMLKKHSFRSITTRTFYSGLHKVSLIVNGEERHIGEFELLAPT
ncbi:DNA alkylation repair protein [uncultured Imperialibacter sp.]|uniref:DNA alkylation repair protein n=1 Tax=uncultured Imperialibacter sp. TaxID=1672639 RepID=UPI0030DAE3C8|tara:strand:- start:141568 stop:142680 length:1113 start_codon:yes stop_codon:yes gene_type:complete